jgi:tetratricopeptide (TPR) repeat protein
LTPAEQTRIDKRGTDSLEAYQLYLKGRSFWNRRTAADFWQAIEYFNAAIELDDEYATAYAGLADTYAHLGLATYSGAPVDEVLPLAKNALLRALELDNEIAEAYAALGFVRTWYDRDWAGAEQAFKRAIELNPNYAPAHQWYSHYLVSQGDYGEAVTQIRKALELDPRSLITHTVASGILAAAGRTDDAIAEVNNALEINPDFWFAHLVLANQYTSQSMFDEALEAAAKAISLSNRAVSAVAVQGFIYGRSGDSAKAMELLHEIERRSATEFVSPHNFALLRIGLGQDEQALDDLERAVPNLNLLYLNTSYEYDTLRSNPRFTAIVRQMNLDPESLR